MKMKITLLLFVCMAMSAGATRILNESSSPLQHHQEDAVYWGRRWRWPWPWFRRPYFPPRNPPPVHRSSPPSPPPVHRSSPPPPPVHHSPSPPPVHHSPPPPPTFSPPVHRSSPPPPPVHRSPPPKQSSQPLPVKTKPPPAPQQPSEDFNDPAQCETALARIDNCPGDLITYFFGDSTSIGQACCDRIKQLSEPCFGRAFMEEPSYYNKVIKSCS